MPNKGPKLGDEFFTERNGVNAVAQKINQVRLLWRETPNADVGIDGQIEYVDDNGIATGALVAVQIKSGASYLVGDTQAWNYTPHDKYRWYWENFPVPVLLIIFDPQTETAYWADVRQQLRISRGRGALRVPKSQIVVRRQRSQLFESCGVFGRPILSPPDLLSEMITRETGSVDFPVSFYELFVNGLADIGRKIFFSMGFCSEVAEARILFEGRDHGVTIGAPEYDFVHEYVQFLAGQNLAVIDYSDYLIDLKERNMVSTFLVPLTSRGHAVLEFIRELAGAFQGPALTELWVEPVYNASWPLRVRANYEVLMKIKGSGGVKPILGKRPLGG